MPDGVPDGVFDGDPQARAKDRDRDRATYVVDAALRNRQITQQDRDLRVERIRSSVTLGELEAVVRDVAAPPVPVPPAAVVPPPAPATAPTASTTLAPDPYAPGAPRPTTPVPSDLYGPPRSTSTGVATLKGSTRKSGRNAVAGCLTVAVLFFIGPIVAGISFFASSFGDSGGASDSTTTEPVPVGPAFELTREGLRDYLTTFENSFDDSQVVRAVFYDGYVVTWVPAGDGQVAIWNYLNGAFEQLGDPMDGTQDTGPVDLADLRPGKVMALVRTARETLGVPDPTTTYVIFDRDVVDNDPQLAVYVTNDAGDSGYLLGDLNGKVTSSQGNG